MDEELQNMETSLESISEKLGEINENLCELVNVMQEISDKIKWGGIMERQTKLTEWGFENPLLDFERNKIIDINDNFMDYKGSD